MPLLSALATTFQVTEFDVLILWIMLIGVMVLYYFITLHRIFEAAFGAIIGMGIYILLVVLLIGNPSLGTEWILFPFGFSVFLVSIAVYLVFILAILFPIRWGLVVSEPTQPTLYTLMYVCISGYLFFTFWAICVYLVEQVYIFKVETIFVFLRSLPWYTEVVKNSWYYAFVMSHQNTIIPLWVVLMLYKLLLSNLVNAALLSIWYNLSHVGFYRSKDDSHYRVEFHEVGWAVSDGHDDHGGHDTHTEVDSHKQQGHSAHH